MIWLLAVAFALYTGIRMGRIESDWRTRRIADNDRRQLPHVLLTTVRLFMALLIAVMVYKIQWATMWCTLLLFIVIVMAHRQSFNHFTKRPYYYMGDPASPKGGSIYDRAFRWMGSKMSGMVELPFLLATAVELGALIVLAGIIVGMLRSLA